MAESRISRQVVKFILTCKNEELQYLTETEVAKRIGINRQYLSRRFKNDRDISISDFILREKIYRAYFILRENSRVDIDELSRTLGFLKVDDFDMEFEKYFAINPEKLRALSVDKFLSNRN